PGAGVQDARARDAEPIALDLEDAEFECLRRGRFADLAGIHLRELVRADVAGDLVRPRPGQRGFEPEQVAEVTSAFPRRDELADVREPVTALEQTADQAQPGEVGVVVDPDAALA